MDMLKGVSCFTDAEAQHPLSISESVVPRDQHLQEWTMSEAAEVVNISLLFFSCFLAVTTFPCNFVCCFVVVLPRLYLASAT